MVRKMYSGSSVVEHDSYQLSFSKGLAESDRSAMHQYTTLLSHLTVPALRPEGRGNGVITKARIIKYIELFKLQKSPFPLPDARVQLALEVRVKVVTQNSVFSMELHCTKTAFAFSQTQSW